MARHYYSGVALDSSLSAALTATAGSGSIRVPEAGNDNGWPSSFPFFLAVDAGTLAEEIVEVTGKGLLSGSTRTWSVNRGANGQVLAHTTNALVRHVWTSMDADDANYHANNDGTDITVHSNLPRGPLARWNTWALRSTPASGAETGIGYMSSTSPGGLPVIVVGRLYRLNWHGNISRSDGAADLVLVRLRVGQNTLSGFPLYSEWQQLPSSFVGAPVGGAVEFVGGASTSASTPTATNFLPTVAAGAQSFTMTIQKNSGTGNTATVGITNASCVVEDLGPAAA